MWHIGNIEIMDIVDNVGIMGIAITPKKQNQQPNNNKKKKQPLIIIEKVR